MMKHKHILAASVICLASFCMASCSSFVGEKLLAVRMGSTVAEILKADEEIVNDESIVITAPDLESKSTYTLLVSKLKSAAKNNRWVYLFKNGRLLYWGYPYQFTRHEDDEIRIAGEALSKALVDKGYLANEKE